jgi:hypothetical protein
LPLQGCYDSTSLKANPGRRLEKKTGQFLIVLAVTAVPFAVISTLLLTAFFGPSELGLRCTRSGGAGQCEVLQSRLLGLLGNSSFKIDENFILGAETLAPGPSVGGRGSANCTVALRLKTVPNREYPVLSYPLCGRAADATRRLNSYFTDTRSTSIEIRDDVGAVWLLVSASGLVAVGALIVRRWAKTN